MGLEFISRIIRMTLILAVLIALFGSVYYNWQESLGILLGAVWGVLNLYFIKGVIVQVVTPKETQKSLAFILVVVKFPVLYVAGYFLLACGYFSPQSLLIGFSLIFAVAFLKVLGRVLLKMDMIEFKKKQPDGNS
ncbi:MAG: hypothetical protein KAT58_07260 [candidate division Zixibacteria bacterium]|nr:hypothetical protein [candidate division Zixibacteria bacterium]